MATSSTDRAACLALAQRHVGDTSGWTPEQWDAQLDEDAVTRGSPAATHFRPYRTALAYLVSPDRVTSRSEGGVSESYQDAEVTRTWLRGLDAEWTAALPDASEEGDAIDLTIRFTGWG